MNRILDDLNEEQLESVTYDGGPLLVVAGAGSGKTRVLTHRIAYLISQGISANNFLAVTFTNKAANEMKERIFNLTGNNEVWVSTFHSAALRILKREINYSGLSSDFVIYDESDQLSLIKDVIAGLRYDVKEYLPKDVRFHINSAKDLLISPKKMLESASTYYEEGIANIYDEYEKSLKKYNAIDFGGLIFKVVDMFENNEIILEKYRNILKYVLVDEYQDTNYAQYVFVKKLSLPNSMITVVGDPDQSIYGWRGADIRNIMSFEKDYENVKTVKLERNYRSTKNILEASNFLISYNEFRHEKKLWTASPEGDKITVFIADDEKEEAYYVANKILELISKGVSLSRIVIFYRIHAQSRPIEDALREIDLNYKIIGSVRFYDRKEIKDIIAYLRFIACKGDLVSFKRIINTPTRGIGLKTVEKIVNYANGKSLDFLSALNEMTKKSLFSRFVSLKLTAFYSMIEGFAEYSKENMLVDLIKKIIDDISYQDYLMREGKIEYKMRMENINELLNSVADFESSYDGDIGGMLSAFLDKISLNAGIDEHDAEEDSVLLMTMHTAKGLEFDTVFVVGMNEEIFPHVNVLNNAGRDLEEERRLCYVAMTRAKRKLYMLSAKKRRLYGRYVYGDISRFIKEIPDKYIEYVGEIGNSFDSDFLDIDDNDDIIYEYI